MTTNEAQHRLLAYRPGADADLEQAAALEQIETDIHLSEWYVNHCQTQAALRDKFRSIPVPSDLKQRILEANQKIIRPAFWERPAAWLAVAACAALLFVVATLLIQPKSTGTFNECRERLVRSAIREYRMDVASSDDTAVRGYMKAHGAPADYTLTSGLQKLALAGGGLMRWQGHPVSMVCFQRPDKQMVYLFVLDHAIVKGAPDQVEISQISKLATASWTIGDRTYVLAVPETVDGIAKYL